MLKATPYTIVQIVLGAYTSFLLVRALRRRASRGSVWRPLDASLTQALYWLLWSILAFLAASAGLLATAYRRGPSWLNTFLGALLLLTSLALTASITICGIRAMKEEERQ